MERFKKKSQIFVIAIAIATFVKSSEALEKYEIVLDNGRKIETQSYWEEEDKVFYQKYGSSIGISKAKVVEINVVQVEQSNTQDSFDSNKPNYSNWDQDTEKKKRKLQSHLAKCEKKLAKIKNKTMEEWERHRKRFNKANKESLSLDEYMDKSIGMQERRCDKIRKRISKVGVLDLAEVDLCEYSTEAKAERNKNIKKQKEMVKTYRQKCTTHKRYCGEARDAEKELERLIKAQAKLERMEMAFAEKLNINLEKEANKSSF